jgi:hypothetical protein
MNADCSKSWPRGETATSRIERNILGTSLLGVPRVFTK